MVRKKVIVLFILTLTLSGAALMVGSASAQQEGINETFDDPQLPGWERSPETVVADGMLRISPGNFAFKPGGWVNFQLNFEFRFELPGEAHFRYCFSDGTNYQLRILEGELVLERITQGAPIEMASTELQGYKSGDWNEIQIELTIGEHTISLNGAQILSVSDQEPLPPGGFFVQNMGEQILEIDNVQLVVSGQEPAPVGGQVSPFRETTAPEAAPAQSTNLSSIIDQLLTTGSSTLSTGTIIINLALAAVSAFILGRVYIYWGASLSNRRKFAANFMLVTVTTTFIIQVVRSSVALSLGLVGALSIIRFRTAIKEPEELAYMFFAIGLGIGLGDNQQVLSLITLAVVIALVGLLRLFRQSHSDVNLHLSVTSRNPSKVTLDRVMDVLNAYCSKLKLLRYDETPEVLEMSFVLEFEHTADLNQTRAALLELSDALQISFLDNKGIW